MKTTISVSIDLTDEFEGELLKHVTKKGNKSRYIKRLIHEDMIGAKRATNVSTEQNDHISEHKKAMAGFF